MPKGQYWLDQLFIELDSSITELALFTSDPTPDDIGDEVAGGSYARQSITWDTPTDNSIANSNTITFSNLPACTVTHWGVYDGSNNLWYYGAFEINIVRTAGQAIDIQAGHLQLSET